MITEVEVRLAAKRQPERYTLVENAEGHLVQFMDNDAGYLWFKLPDGVWAWIA